MSGEITVGELVDSVMEKLTEHIESEIHAVCIAHFGDHFTHEVIAARCMLTAWHATHPRTLLIDGRPVLEIYPVVSTMKGWLVTYTQNVRRFA